MAKVAHAYTNDKPGAELPNEAPKGQVNDPSYKTSKNEAIPVIDDGGAVEDHIRPGAADSDKQLQQDEREAIDKSNIIKGGRTRHARPLGGSYEEPSDEQMGLTKES
ncbi:hypothetical protein OQA88_743 [Cercophora sp. LCS_1]